MSAEEPNDIAEGNVWPPYCEECDVEGHGWANCPENPDRIPDPPPAGGRFRPRDWPRSSRGMDPGLFC